MMLFNVGFVTKIILNAQYSVLAIYVLHNHEHNHVHGAQYSATM